MLSEGMPVAVDGDRVIETVHWVQLPRLYNLYKEQGIIENFEQLLDNIFHPLFEVTRDPNSHPQLHLFLKNVGSALLLLTCCSLHGPVMCGGCLGFHLATLVARL